MQAQRSKQNFAATLILPLFGVALIERAMGRSFWCPAGDLALASWDINSVHNSQHLVDPYSLTHVSHGLIFFVLISALARFKAQPFASKLLLAVLIESAWEIIENTSFIINRFRESTVSLGYFGDSILNSLSDIFFMMFGAWLASRLPVKFALLLVIALELICYCLIRDSLLLEIIQIIHPLH